MAVTSTEGRCLIHTASLAPNHSTRARGQRDDPQAQVSGGRRPPLADTPIVSAAVTGPLLPVAEPC